jgi:hypothetical protein
MDEYPTMSLTKRDEEMNVFRVVSVEVHDRVVIQMVIYARRHISDKDLVERLARHSQWS